MRFTVFSFAPIPDIATARDNFDLHDLSDKDVAKVLFHQRKQKTGHSELLTWDQLQIASISLVHYSLDYVEMGSHSLQQLAEPQLIHKFYQALAASGQVVSWDGNSLAMPLLHFRCMQHRISHPGYWQALRKGEQVHTDLCEALLGADNSVSLEDLAQRFRFPGMLGNDLDSVWEGYLAGDYEAVSRYSDYHALNTYLLALEVMSLQGDMSYADAARARKKLRDYLEKDSEPRARYRDFLDAWDGRG